MASWPIYWMMKQAAIITAPRARKFLSLASTARNQEIAAPAKDFMEGLWRYADLVGQQGREANKAARGMYSLSPEYVTSQEQARKAVHNALVDKYMLHLRSFFQNKHRPSPLTKFIPPARPGTDPLTNSALRGGLESLALSNS